MVKKIFIVEIKESDKTCDSLSAGQVLHAIMPIAQRVYSNNGTHECLMESIKVEEYYKA